MEGWIHLEVVGLNMTEGSGHIGVVKVVQERFKSFWCAPIDIIKNKSGELSTIVIMEWVIVQWGIVLDSVGFSYFTN